MPIGEQQLSAVETRVAPFGNEPSPSCVRSESRPSCAAAFVDGPRLVDDGLPASTGCADDVSNQQSHADRESAQYVHRCFAGADVACDRLQLRLGQPGLAVAQCGGRGQLPQLERGVQPCNGSRASAAAPAPVSGDGDGDDRGAHCDRPIADEWCLRERPCLAPDPDPSVPTVDADDAAMRQLVQRRASISARVGIDLGREDVLGTDVQRTGVHDPRSGGTSDARKQRTRVRRQRLAQGSARHFVAQRFDDRGDAVILAPGSLQAEVSTDLRQLIAGDRAIRGQRMARRLDQRPHCRREHDAAGAVVAGQDFAGDHAGHRLLEVVGIRVLGMKRQLFCGGRAIERNEQADQSLRSGAGTLTGEVDAVVVGPNRPQVLRRIVRRLAGRRPEAVRSLRVERTCSRVVAQVGVHHPIMPK